MPRLRDVLDDEELLRRLSALSPPISTVEGLCACAPPATAAAIGAPVADFLALLSQVSARYAAVGVPASVSLAHAAPPLSTGVPALDAVLDGGVRAEITELVGASGTGKTQLCVTMAAEAAAAGGGVAYVDASNHQPARRLMGVLRARFAGRHDDADTLAALSRVGVHAAGDLREVALVVERLRASADQDHQPPLRLVVVDSLATAATPALTSDAPETQAEARATLEFVARRLRTLAYERGAAVVVTNHLVGGDEGGSRKPALGRAWRGAPAVRLELVPAMEAPSEAAGTGLAGTAVLTKSPRAPVPQEAAFGVSGAGAIGWS